MQSKIFVPNFTTKSSGTGLGLAMCKSIVEQAHGKIWFETKLGEGTTFHIELPLGKLIRLITWSDFITLRISMKLSGEEVAGDWAILSLHFFI